jgi:hypothetical protein
MKYKIKAELLEKIIKNLEEICRYLFRQLKKRYPLFSSNKLDKLESELASLKTEAEGKKETAEIKIQTMEGTFSMIQQITEDTEELNMANYSYEQVGRLNNAMIEIYKIIHIQEFYPAKPEQEDNKPPKYPLSNRDFTMTDKLKEDYPVYDEDYLNECMDKSRLNNKESYFIDPKGEGWPELEDDCAPD